MVRRAAPAGRTLSARFPKWRSGVSCAGSWQIVQSISLVKACKMCVGCTLFVTSLYCCWVVIVLPALWHARHPALVLVTIIPVRQLGAGDSGSPPWQLTEEQVSAVPPASELSNAAGPP